MAPSVSSTLAHRGPAARTTSLSHLFEDAPTVEVTDLAYDSRHVKPGSLFFCVRGFDHDGHDFAEDAVRRGACAVVAERPLALEVPVLRVPLVRAAMAPAAARFFGDPSAELGLVGVTGTNGKTTTSFLVRAIVEAAGFHCGLIGTIKRTLGGIDKPSIHTTPEAVDIQRDLRSMVNDGDRFCAMEVSSHGLALCRCDALSFAVTVFTNVTRDHLDFHRTMEDYFQVKRQLFVSDSGIAIVNVDDPYGARLAKEITGARTFAIDGPADYRARILSRQPTGMRLELAGPDGSLTVSTHLAGRFNAYNVLGAYAAARELGLPGRAALGGIDRTTSVPGRFERLDAGQPFDVFIDYAHTPDALENVLVTARELTRGRLICVFGCAGNRDPGARPAMGRIARWFADFAIVTTDDPREEDPNAIIDEILDRRPAGLEVVVDRATAIFRAVELARPGDTVVITGRGHEAEQSFADATLHLDDRHVAVDAWRSLAQRRARAS
jgi:UDP-N-acetylmuramoyl-L-alanyl-D-glutamate--2,6-diaminopimelate ligase